LKTEIKTLRPRPHLTIHGKRLGDNDKERAAEMPALQHYS